MCGKSLSRLHPVQRYVFLAPVQPARPRPFSDLDLLFTEPSTLTWAQRAALRDGFEASCLPFRVDVVESAGLSGAVAERIQAERVNMLML